MNSESLLAQFDALLPLAAACATEQEQEILREVSRFPQEKLPTRVRSG